MKNFDIAKYNEILDRGLSGGVGTRQGSMCIEAAVCAALDLPHGDDPKCVAASVRKFKIRLNDARWSSTAARSAGLRDLGIAQLGSVDIPDLNQEFARRIALQTIQQVIPAMLRDLHKDKYESHALACEQAKNLKESRSAAYVAYSAAYAAYAAAAAADAAADAFWRNWRYRRWYVRPYYVLRRSAYWRIAGMPGSSPWEPLVEIYKLGCVPIGFVNGEFVVYVPSVKKSKAK